jgi:hypothetical protein
MGKPREGMGQKVPIKGYLLYWQRMKAGDSPQGRCRSGGETASIPASGRNPLYVSISHLDGSRRQPVIARLKDGSHLRSEAVNPWRLRCSGAC